MVDQVLSVWEWNQGHIVTRRAHIHTGAAYLKPRLLSELQTLRIRRDAQGQWNAKVDLGLALGKGCRQERLLISCVPPTMEMLGALLDPALHSHPHPPLDCGTFSTCVLLKHTSEYTGQRKWKPWGLIHTYQYSESPWNSLHDEDSPTHPAAPALWRMSQFADGSHVEGTAMGSPEEQPPRCSHDSSYISPESWTPDVSYTRGFQVLFKQWKSLFD